MSAIGDYSRIGTPSANPVHANCHYTNEDYAYADTSYNYLGAGFISSFSYENNRAYFSAITNPATKRYLAWNDTSFVPLDFAIQVRPVTGSSITFDFELDHDPYLITTDRVWSGEIFIPDSVNVVVMDGATLTILPDTRIFIGKDNARITTWSGGRILAIGGNRFEWCVFEYGTKHIEIASRDNEVRNSIFRNGWRGISSYSNQSGSGPSSSEVLLDQVLLTDNRTVGFVGYYSDSKVSNTTVTHNGEAGAWYMYASGLSFHKSRVDSNAVASSTRSGVEANTGSVVHLMRYHGGAYLQGDNSIRAQPTYQVLRANGSTLHMGNYYTVGEPGWSNIHGGSSYLVRNLGSGTVTAHENYWGVSDPDGSMFEGSFDYDFYHSSAVSVFGASSLPVESHYYRDQYLKGRPGGGAADEDKSSDGRTLMATRAAELRGRMSGADVDPDELAAFLDLATSMWDPAWHEADRQANRAVLDALYRKAMSEEPPTWPVEGVLALALREQVLEDPVRAERTARDILAAHEAPGVRLAAAQALMVLAEQRGDLAEARAELMASIELMPEAGYRPDDIAAFRSMWEGQLANRPEAAFLRRASGHGAPARRDGALDASEAAALVTIHPNPFNPETVVAVELRADGPLRVDVYDMLGRRVRTLADGHMTAGRHSLRLDGARLASGVYLVRVSAAGHTTTRRITLVK